MREYLKHHKIRGCLDSTDFGEMKNTVLRKEIYCFIVVKPSGTILVVKPAK